MAMTSHECEKCLSDVLTGKSDGLRQIYETYYPAVFALALSILKDYQKAEDAAQEVFLKIWNSADSYRFGANPKAWIMQISRNLSLDYLRKSKHETLNMPLATVAWKCARSVKAMQKILNTESEG